MQKNPSKSSMQKRSLSKSPAWARPGRACVLQNMVVWYLEEEEEEEVVVVVVLVVVVVVEVVKGVVEIVVRKTMISRTGTKSSRTRY